MCSLPFKKLFFLVSLLLLVLAFLPNVFAPTVSQRVTCIFGTPHNTSYQECYINVDNSGNNVTPFFCSGTGQCSVTVSAESTASVIDVSASCSGSNQQVAVDGTAKTITVCGTAETCTDTDSTSSNPNETAGRTTFNNQTFRDVCISATQLNEHSCDIANGVARGVKHERINCPGGCENGACKPLTCTDSDGENQNVKGTVTYGTQRLEDQCAGKSGRVIEFLCVNNKPFRKAINCPAPVGGKAQCVNGACIPTSQVQQKITCEFKQSPEASESCSVSPCPAEQTCNCVGASNCTLDLLGQRNQQATVTSSTCDPDILQSQLVTFDGKNKKVSFDCRQELIENIACDFTDATTAKTCTVKIGTATIGSCESTSSVPRTCTVQNVRAKPGTTVTVESNCGTQVLSATVDGQDSTVKFRCAGCSEGEYRLTTPRDGHFFGVDKCTKNAWTAVN